MSGWTALARRAEAQRSCFRLDESANSAIGLLEQRPGPGDVVGEEPSRWGQGETRPAAHEGDTEFPLQRGDVLGHGRLAHIEHAHKIRHAALRFAQEVEDGAAMRFREDLEEGGHAS